MENRLVPAALAGCDADWLMEVAPVSGPSPALDRVRHRVLFDADRIVWPFLAHLDEWPLDESSVPAVLLRHVWQPAVGANPLPELNRVLKPGGLLVSVSANPWHAAAWRSMGRSAARLPSWPSFQLLHAREGFELSVAPVDQARGMVPGVSPVLVIIARKPARPARIKQLRFSQPRVAPVSVPASRCEAA